MISRKHKARWRRYFEEHPETPRKPRPVKLPHDEVHERRAASHRKPVVGISARTGERIRFESMMAAEFLFAQGETSSVVAAQLIILLRLILPRRVRRFSSSFSSCSQPSLAE